MTAAAGIAPRTITLLGLGEAGTALARGFCAESRWLQGDKGRRVLGVDIALGEGPRGRAMAERAQALGIDASQDYGPRLDSTDLAVSVVTGEDAPAAAESMRPHLRPRALYLDCNSITGNQTRAVADVFAGTGVDFVDVAVMGSFATFGYRVPMLLSGPRAAEAAAWMEATGMSARVLNDRVGDASSVKILRSVLVKGIEALSVECLTAAHRQGLVDEVLETLADADRMGLAQFIRMLTTTHLVHARRRMEEVEKAEFNLHETGIAPVMTEATRRTLARTVAAGAIRDDGVVPDIETALDTLATVAAKEP